MAGPLGATPAGRVGWLRSRPFVLVVVVSVFSAICALVVPAADAASLTDLDVDLSVCSASANANATLSVSGAVGATELGSSVAKIGSYFVVVSYASLAKHSGWVALGGYGASASGYTPSMTMPPAPPLTFGASGVSAPGVVYPRSGDPIVGTTVVPHARAGWSVGATVGMSASTAVLLSNPALVGNRLQVVFHAEGDHRVMGHSQSTQTIANPFQAAGKHTRISGPCPGGAPAGVSGALSGALLDLSPLTAGPNVIGSMQALSATLKSGANPISGQAIVFKVSGPNATTTSATTNAQGVASFSYSGSLAGLDHVQASATSPGGTIYSSPASVSWVSLANASLGLLPANVPNDVLGTTQVLTAILGAGGQPIAHQSISFTVTGANPTTGSATTNSQGVATFSYVGNNLGADTVVATSTGGGSSVASAASHITWVAAAAANATNPQAVATTPVVGNFYAEPSTTTSFVALPGDTPAFRQSFPNIEFNPPIGAVVGEPASGPSPTTRPFTDVTIDQGGGFSGTIPARGNGFQAGRLTGTKDLRTFDASFTASLNVGKAEDITFKITADDGYLFGVGGGATKVSGATVGTSATTTPFNAYPLDAAYNQTGPGTPTTYAVTVHFPAAGTYPYELDYLSCCDNTMSLTLGIATTGTNPVPFNVSAGYADNTRPGGTTSFPNPWSGAPNTTFVGDSSPFDTGALRFDNPTGQPLTLDAVSVDIGTHHYVPTPGPRTVPAAGSLILASTAGNFDTSEAVTPGGSGGGGGGGTPPVLLPAPGTAAPGWSVQNFATGFANYGPNNIGPMGLAFSASGQLYVGSYFDNFLYRFGPTGGAAAGARLGGPGPTGGLFGLLMGLAFSKSGRLYAVLDDQVVGNGEIDELDPVTGAKLRVLTTFGSFTAARDLAVDPISGDLFVTEAAQETTIMRMSHFEDAGPVTLTPYAVGGVDGFTIAPDGTIYAVQSCGCVNPHRILRIAGTDTPQPAAVTVLASTTNPIDGIGLINPPVGQPVTKVVVNRNDGVLTQVDFSTNPATLTDIYAGGSRGDFARTGPDGCLYATQTDSVVRVSAADGTCPFVPPTVCSANATVPMVNVTYQGHTVSYPDPALALTAGGLDGEVCGNNESQPWTPLTGQGTGVSPLPPAVALSLSPPLVKNDLVNTSQALTVAATDEAGHPAAQVPVTLSIGGTNPQTLNATTNAAGIATFSYVSAKAGTDQLSASAVVAGVASISNLASVTWVIPAPGGPTPSATGPAPPYATITAPTDGQTVMGPVAVVGIVNPPPTSPIATFTVTAKPVGGGSAVTLASGTGPPPSQLATFDPTARAPGTYAITFTATTAAGSSAAAVTRVVIPSAGGGGGGTPAQAPPTVTVTSPADGSTLTQPTPVTATITAPTGQTISSWNATYHTASSPTPVPLASGTGAPPTTLATFDPTLLPIGTYLVVVSATAGGGGTQTATVGVSVPAGAKIGRYVTTFNDLSIPVEGFNADVTRVYDSTDKTVGDFGVGWHLGASNYKVSVNAPLGAGGWSATPNQCSLFGCSYAFRSSSPHFVTVTFPDGHQEMFDFTPQGGFGPLFFFGQPVFTARANTPTVSSLAVDSASDPGVQYGFDSNLYAGSTNGSYNPTRFVLTETNGMKLLLDESAGLLSETDLHGNTLAFDATGIHATAAGNVAEPGIAFTRDGQGRITKITGPTNQTITYTYTPGGDLASVTDPVGNITTFTYDTNHHLLKTTGPGGPLRTQTYDTAGRLTSITDANGHTTTVANNVGASQQVLTDPNGILTRVLTFDTQGNITAVQRLAAGVSRTSSFAYNALGEPTSAVDPLGNTTTFAYDAKGNRTSTTDPNGHTSTSTYNNVGEPLSRTDALGHTSAAAYDAVGNLTSFTDVTGHITQLSYDPAGNPLTVTVPSGAAYAFLYDATGNLLSLTDPLGHSATNAYDASGHRLSGTDALGKTTSNTYDADGHQTSITDPLGGVTATAYDALGRVFRVTDPNGNTTTYAHDLNGNLTQIVDATGHSVTEAYDMDNHLISLTDPDGRTRINTYDAFGESLAAIDPATGTTTSAFDAADRLTARTNALGTTHYVDDPAGQLVGETAGALTTTWTYDAAGQRIQMTDATGTTGYSYDAAGRVTGVTSPQGALTYGYDANGQRASLGLGNGKSITSGYDTAGRLTSLTDWANAAINLTYDADGHLTGAAYPNGVTTTTSFDPAGRIASVISTKGATVLASTAYARDHNGNPTTITTPTGSTAYTYDQLSRLTRATGTTNQTYSYDPAGNITQVTNGATTTPYTYDATTGLLTGLGAQAVTYEPAGDITGVGTQAFTWDPLGRLASTTTGGATTTYTYNGDGLLATSSSGATTTPHQWDPVHGEGKTLGGLATLAIDGTDAYLPGPNGPLAHTALGTGTQTGDLTDAQGSVIGATDATGAKVASATYDPYGSASAIGTIGALGYAGQLQQSSGLVYLRARWMNPSLASFLSADTVQPNGEGTAGFNRFTYAADSPMTRTDPTGHTTGAEDAGLDAALAGVDEELLVAGTNPTADAAVVTRLKAHSEFHQLYLVLVGLYGGVAVRAGAQGNAAVRDAAFGVVDALNDLAIYVAEIAPPLTTTAR